MSDVVERAKADMALWDRSPCVEIEVITGMTAAEDAYRRAPETIAELVAEVERLRPRVIETVEQLDALPDLSVVRDKVGTIWEKEHYVGPVDHWWTTGNDEPQPVSCVRLPAVVLLSAGGAA
ncbi:hypothetical protein HWC44_gp055 [Mycobacterium phage ThetaBob]|uniref:Uncharacterized protein n=1 Tax=Mycobacterium phage ThetaBob TaxID=2588513 RepID=A0A4Y6EN92_9CAUD|nr:hypothetical protein HWC44_gp055 [Mycobacterium phage ThetaBob]QDF19942.1 hypothetical protein SEA_THETABOB_55 [Mycobacterium phage ThetaBob]